MNRLGFKDKVLLGAVGATLAFEAPEGRPSGDGTVTLYDPRYQRTDSGHNPITTGAATRRAVATTFTGASGFSQSSRNRVVCAPPGALVVGDFVRVTNAAKQAERGEVAAIGAGYVDLVDDLAFDYAIADLVESAVMTSPAVPTAWAAAVANLDEDFEAVWSYTVAGVTYAHTSRWDLVREVADFSIGEDQLLDFFPDFASLGNNPATFARFMRAAVKEVDAVLRARGLQPDRVRGHELVRWMTIMACQARAAMNGRFPPGMTAADYLAATKGEWDLWRTQFLDGRIKFPVDDNNDGVNAPSEKRLTRRKLIK